jgi:hypothetical protein
MANLVFVPTNPKKYAGDARRIVARSSWEIAYMRALDNSIHVSKWFSEPKNLNITYLDPITKQVKHYWPDFLVQYTNNTLEIVEIKPLKEAMMSEAKSNYDKLMLIRNAAKWQAAENLAKAIGARFRLVTERELFAQAQKRPSTRQTKGAIKSRGTKGTRK